MKRFAEFNSSWPSAAEADSHGLSSISREQDDCRIAAGYDEVVRLAADRDIGEHATRTCSSFAAVALGRAALVIGVRSLQRANRGGECNLRYLK